MFGDYCYWIINMSIVASFMGLIVMLIRKLRFIPRRVSVFLWIIPFIRMLIPFGLSSRLSLMTLVSKFTTRTVTVMKPSDDLAFTTSNTIMAAKSYDPITYKTELLENVFDIASVIWLVGALAIMITLMILYASTMREIADSKHLKKNIFLSEKVTGPAVYGILRPKIILPASYADIDTKYVLRHETTHIRRLDNLWRLLGFLTAAIHWFNPLSWVFLKAFLSDIELACDEMAVKGYDDTERREYAKTLLGCAASRNLFASAFGGAKIRTRIEHVLSYKKMTIVSAVGFTLLILVIIYILLTNAA